MPKIAKKTAAVKTPSPHDWRTTDADEINKRRLRAREELFTISNSDPLGQEWFEDLLCDLDVEQQSELIDADNADFSPDGHSADEARPPPGTSIRTRSLSNGETLTSARSC